MGIYRQHCRDIGRQDIRTKIGVDIVLDHPEHSKGKNLEKWSLGKLASQNQNFGPPVSRGRLGGSILVPIGTIPCTAVHLAWGSYFWLGAMRVKKGACVQRKTWLN